MVSKNYRRNMTKTAFLKISKSNGNNRIMSNTLAICQSNKTNDLVVTTTMTKLGNDNTGQSSWKIANKDKENVTMHQKNGTSKSSGNGLSYDFFAATCKHSPQSHFLVLV